MNSFEYIFNADGTCGARFDCSNPGVILAYDEFNPETATWFCEECWQEEEDSLYNFCTEIVEDRRVKNEMC